MTFRRALKSRKFPKCCLNGENCRNCRFYQYQKFLAVEMKWLVPLPLKHLFQPLTPYLQIVINQLKLMDNRGKHVFHSYALMDDFNLDTLVLYTSTNYIAKHEHFHFTRHGCAAISHTTGIDFIKKFEFISLLSAKELIGFIEKAIMPYTLFCTAMRSYTNRREAAEFPGGVDVICEDLEVCDANAPAVLDNLRHPLVAKLKELKITNEEFLLLSAVTICNSVAAKLSDESPCGDPFYSSDIDFLAAMVVTIIKHKPRNKRKALSALKDENGGKKSKLSEYSSKQAVDDIIESVDDMSNPLYELLSNDFKSKEEFTVNDIAMMFKSLAETILKLQSQNTMLKNQNCILNANLSNLTEKVDGLEENLKLLSSQPKESPKPPTTLIKTFASAVASTISAPKSQISFMRAASLANSEDARKSNVIIKNIDLSSMNYILSNIDWDLRFSTMSIDEMFDDLRGILLELIEYFVPTVTHLIHNIIYSKETKQLLKKKLLIWKKAGNSDEYKHVSALFKRSLVKSEEERIYKRKSDIPAIRYKSNENVIMSDEGKAEIFGDCFSEFFNIDKDILPATGNLTSKFSSDVIFTPENIE
ncbi:Protein CBG01192 [Caenorhabditis briggsae]|uniref:Protein CBG01192 n=1 Tax=Caenorhabditis briggsae TaxID=6238 RepID=A8WPT1_CAEBR|nr:Protein CBG01192 [Caenorhabditis briggsae]CAP22488.1 Protein CBG01192 [Caenorhabditis briggsae]